MKKLLKRIIALIMLMTICVTSIYTSAYAQTSWDGVSKSRIYEEDGFKVTMSLSSYWNGGYNADIKIENTSDTAKENWYLGFEYDDVITNIWNAEIVTNESGYYVIKNATWNQDIAPKSYVQFGFSSNEDFGGFPEEIKILGTSVELSADDYIIDYKLDNDWGTGFVSTISITNISEDTIEDWLIEFDYDREITNIWNGTIESHEGNHYVIKNAGYNANIGAGQSIAFGFNGCDGVETDVPYDYKLIAYKVLDSDGDGIPDAVEGESETDVKAEIELYAFGFYNDENNSVDIEWCTNYENGEFEIWHSNDNLEYTLVENVGKAENYQYDIVDDFEMKYFKVVMLTECGESIESFPVSIVRSEEGYTTALIDTDNDNIADMLEKIYGTDYNKFDTDSDGLSDYQEIFVTLTDPIVYDSVVEGVADSDADSDSDGISNINEISIETNPVAEDTDEDGLLDGEEVNTYGTSPIVKDTDIDGLEDGDEPYLSLDPMNPETYDVPDSEYVVLQQIDSDSEVFLDINTCERLEINYSELMPEGYYYISSSYGQQVYEAICSTNGVSLTYGVTSANDVYNHICNHSVEAQTEFAAKLPLGWKKIILDGVLDPYNGVNSDEDNLTDWKEVKSELLKWDTNGNLVLPTVEECMDTVSKYTNGTFGATKVLNIYDRFELNNDMLDNESLGFKSYVDYILDYKVLPINSDPTEEDSDNDGLLDGTEVYVEESNGEKRVIAPKDPEPLKKTGISGIWKEQINQEKNGVIATDYADNSIGMGLSFSQKMADDLIQDLLKSRDDINKTGEEIRAELMAVKRIMEGDTVVGAFLLNFIYDDKHIAYHSQVDTWQRDFGYNDLYDDAFRIGSYMHYGKVVFEDTSRDEEYILWLWKGDYWNLQSGAEIGLYVYDKNVEGTQHYDVVDFEMPMTLSLYNYYSSDDIENLFNWQPEDDQWITGFNPEYIDANPEYMVAMGKIDFTGHEELFEGIKNSNTRFWQNISKDNMIFDEDGHTLWIMWDYGV